MQTLTKDRWCAVTAASLFLLAGSIVSLRGAEAPDKGRYHLLNPTPREFMRELATDRPDKTESPYTLDAGHFQFEMDVLNYSYDRYNSARADTRVESLAIAPINFKVGLCNRVDLQLIVPSYNADRTHDRAAGTVDKQRGFGDVVSRLKVNVWGNDGGATAFGVMPFVKLPTHQDQLGNNSVEGGVILPLAVTLPKGWAMGMMTEVDFIRDGAGRGHHPEFINTITFGHDIVGNLGGYMEFFSAVSAESGSHWIGTADVGLTYGLTKDIQLDAGVNFGLTRSADDINPFFGVSWRF